MRVRSPLEGEHYCGDFPGAGGVTLRNKVHVYYHESSLVSDRAPGFYWWNAKEGNGHNRGGPFSSAWAAYADAFSYYPAMAECEKHAYFLQPTDATHPKRRNRARLMR